jgi:hypothetical protein
MTEARWWTCEELATTRQKISPDNLLALLKQQIDR